MNGKQMMFPPGAAPQHALPPPHHAYMPMSSMSAASFSPSISPNSSVIMTPKSAGGPQFGKPQQTFALHHLSNSSPPNVTPYGQSHSAPWTAQNQFVFPSPTAMSSFANNPPPLTSTTHANNTLLTQQQWM